MMMLIIVMITLKLRLHDEDYFSFYVEVAKFVEDVEVKFSRIATYTMGTYMGGRLLHTFFRLFMKLMHLERINS